jgi:hypothetical protein
MLWRTGWRFDKFVCCLWSLIFLRRRDGVIRLADLGRSGSIKTGFGSFLRDARHLSRALWETAYDSRAPDNTAGARGGHIGRDIPHGSIFNDAGRRALFEGYNRLDVALYRNATAIWCAEWYNAIGDRESCVRTYAHARPGTPTPCRR